VSKCSDANNTRPTVFFNQYVNPVALGALGWKYYIVYDCWIAFELFIVYMFYVEVKNTPLEEIAKYFDGADAIVGGAGKSFISMPIAKHITHYPHSRVTP